MEIRYLTHKEIDKQKWDFCIKNSFNSSIEAYSWYLDTVCETWDALVQTDYLRVMPLPIIKKYGLHIIANPTLTNNLGIYSIGKLNEDITQSFFATIPKRIRYYEIKLNRYNKIHSKDLLISKTYSYAFDLIRSYPDIHNNFSNDFLEKLSIAESQKFTIKRKIPIIDYLTFHVANNAHIKDVSKNKNLRTFKKLLELLTKQAIAEIRGVVSEKGEIICAGIFTSYLNSVSAMSLEINELGKKYHADALLIDECVREFSGRNIVMDFSALHSYENIALLKEMAAYLTEFTTVRKNKLPWLVKNITKQ